LDKYGADGHEIVYTVDETPVAGYTKAISGTAATGFTITNTITAKVSVPVTKVWVGPSAPSVTIKLLADGVEKDSVTLNAANGWAHTFTNLDKYKNGTEIVYTVQEEPVTNYDSAVTGDATTGFKVTNTNTEKTSVKVTKAWVGTPAASATVKLLADGAEKETVTLTATDNWTHTFTNLDKYAADGHEIAYTVDETPVAGYAKDISGTAATGFTIKNTNTETINIPVTKTWVGTAGTSATIKLLADGAEKETVTLTAADNWTHTFSNLPKFDTTDGHEIVYTVDEVDVPNYTKGISGTAATGFTVTNTITGKVSVPVTKVWVGPQASSAKVTLFADGVEKDSVTLNAANGWAHTFTNLDKYNNGTEIVYTVTEEPIANYDSVVTGDAATGFKETNTNTEKTSVDVTKTWVGTPEASSAKVTLYADGVEKDSVTLNAANNWVHVFSNLDKYNNGTEIVYTVTEEPIANYDSAITGDVATGFTVTNTNTEKVAVDVTKNWVGPATDSVTIKLLADGAEVESAVITAAENWMHTFSNLPKYAADGHEIVYTVDEYDVPSYVKAIEGTSSTGFTVTNTITGKVDIPVTKVWVGPATDSVTVNLYADGVKVDTVQLTATNQWKHTFANLDKYENGREIVYTVDEVLIPGYKTKITGDVQTGFTITNSKETPKTADHVNPMAYASIFVISLMAAIMTMIEKKKFAK